MDILLLALEISKLVLLTGALWQLPWSNHNDLDKKQGAMFLYGGFGVLHFPAAIISYNISEDPSVVFLCFGLVMGTLFTTYAVMEWLNIENMRAHRRQIEDMKEHYNDLSALCDEAIDLGNSFKADSQRLITMIIVEGKINKEWQTAYEQLKTFAPLAPSTIVSPADEDYTPSFLTEDGYAAHKEFLDKL